MTQPPIVISTKASLYFAKIIARSLGVKVLATQRKIFGGIEHYYRLGIENFNDLFGRDIVFVGSAHSDKEINEIYRVGCALAGYGARKIIFCIPFMGYSTMERAVKPGEVVTAKTTARQFSAIPQASMGNTFLLLDLHVGGTVHYFEGDCTRFELYAEPVIEAGIRFIIKHSPSIKTMMASADLGRAKWVETFASIFDTDIAFIQKRRDGNETSVQGIIGDVSGRHIIIYDDMTRSAGTLIKACKTYLNYDASFVSVVLSHLALNNKGVAQTLIDSQIGFIITTNSHPASQWSIVKNNTKFKVLDVSGIFTDAIEKILG
ncbi:MAG: ribose-phosphate diphosphokinase [Candidatus Buchananbacteria bacterium]|nr:ribose-phosphate diphosphokinase [Candidatus Buchananbacteria bacterium]